MDAEPPAQSGSGARFLVRLYIAGDGPNSIAAVANLRRALLDQPHEPHQVEVIDVLADPGRALRDGIFVTPMLVKVSPLPERRILGTLRDRAALLGAIGLAQVPHG